MNLASAPGVNAYSPQKAAGLLSAPARASTPAASQAAPSWLPSSSLPVAKMSDLVSLSDAGKNASRLDMLGDRVDALQSGAVDTAQNFLGQFAQQLLGDDAAGAKFSFDSASVSAQSSFSMAATASSDKNGSTSAAAMRLDDQASFSGKGTITTADGRTFSFEIEVSYESSAEAAAATSVTKAPAADDADAAPATDAAPAKSKKPANNDMTVNFPGSVADLLKMFSQNMLDAAFATPPKDQTADSSQGDSAGKQGKLRLRLLDLLQQPADGADAADPARQQKKKVDKAYGNVAPASASTTAPANA